MFCLVAALKMRQQGGDGGHFGMASKRMLLMLMLYLCFHMTSVNGNRYEDLVFDSAKDTVSLVLPHDTYPGFSIKRISSKNSSTSSISLYTLNKEFSKYFTVLDNGMLITTSDLSPLVNKPVNLVVMEETPNSTAQHQLQLFIMDRKDMLRFPGASLEVFGEVKENQEPGTKVQGVPLLQANSASGNKAITYSITDGNTDDAFTLQHSLTKVMKNTLTIKHGEKSGIWLVTKKPLDREYRNNYTVFVQATDDEGLDKATSKIEITVLDENDNAPVFTHSDYKFSVAGTKTKNLDGNASVVWNRFTSIGRVEAKDRDGDKVSYKLLTPNNFVIIVPQTGELLLAGEPEKSELMLKVQAHDLRTPSLSSEKPTDVLIEFVAPDPTSIVVQHLSHDEAFNQHSHRRDKRRVTRAVRPTKRIEFTEADGDAEGKSVFQLEKETDRETFKIRDENPWVTVEPNGAVRVKKKWDYEELGPEKTIDFWVIITNSGQNGKLNYFCNLFHFISLFMINMYVLPDKFFYIHFRESG